MTTKLKEESTRSISFTVTEDIFDEVITLAKDHKTNRSWMGRYLLRNSLNKLTFNQIAKAVRTDPESGRRIKK